MFDELEQSHVRLITALDDLADVTCDRLPDRQRYTQSRFRLSHASFTRRVVVDDAVQFLLAGAPRGEAQPIRQLQSAGAELRRQSTAHVSRWTADAIEADWPAYCAEAGVLRLRMKARVDAEKRVIYPLLEQRARR